MVALAPTPPSRIIRVYCPTHKVGFSASVASVVQCLSQRHTLSTDFSRDGFWEYCCDCQHYWPLDAAKGNTAADECPACERTFVRSFLCEECQVVSVESDSPGRRKEFSISSEGLPHPSCPGCLHKPLTTDVQHECADFGRAFTTTRSTCPFCDEPLYPKPQFPCSVVTFRSSVRRQLPTLQFDSQSNLLTQSSTGGYLLLDADGSKSIVVPNTSHLSSKQEYYNLYYELFNCDNPAAGTVFILSPAIVERVEHGWLLREPGVIEIKGDPEPISSPQKQLELVCQSCGTQSDSNHTFCKRCGIRLKPAEVVHVTEPSEVDRAPSPSFNAETPIYSSPGTETASGPS